MLTTFLLAAGVALFGAVQNANRIVETNPESPTSSTELLFRTALTEVLEERFELAEHYEKLNRHGGPALLLRDSPLISARILPTQSTLGVALLSREELEALAESGKRDNYLSMRLISYSDETAVVSIYLGPLLRKNHFALCCWTLDIRYDHSENGWRFVRIVQRAVH